MDSLSMQSTQSIRSRVLTGLKQAAKMTGSVLVFGAGMELMKEITGSDADDIEEVLITERDRMRNETLEFQESIQELIEAMGNRTSEELIMGQEQLLDLFERMHNATSEQLDMIRNDTADVLIDIYSAIGNIYPEIAKNMSIMIASMREDVSLGAERENVDFSTSGEVEAEKKKKERYSIIARLTPFLLVVLAGISFVVCAMAGLLMVCVKLQNVRRDIAKSQSSYRVIPE